MNNKILKKLAIASYNKNQLDLKRVNRIIKNLNRIDLKKYIKELKTLENKKKVYVYIAMLTNKDTKNQFKKQFLGKDVIFIEDKSLVAGVKIVNNDLVFEQNIKNNLNEMINYIGL